MPQSKQSSAVEVTLNILIGYITALAAQLIIFPWYGIEIAMQSHLSIGVWFSVINLTRMYIIRRWFNTFSF